MRSIRNAALVLLSLFLSATLAQRPGSTDSAFGLEAGPHSVGFRLLEQPDRSRAVSGGGARAPRPRPIRTYLWYPAEPTAERMRFGRYAALADEDIWPSAIAGGVRERLRFSRRPLARSLGVPGFEALSSRPVLAMENAEPLDGPFPLIVVGQGLYYESPIALAGWGEFLAGRGFVVATAPLVGTHSPIVKLDVQDLETQVRDLEFVIARARELPFVGQDRLGVLGFDMGGMAGLILTMRNRDVDAFMSLDAGILFEHPSGLPRIAPDYDPLALRVPWFHATGANGAMPPSDSAAESLFAAASNAERYLLVAEGVNHVGFTSYALLDGRSAVDGYWGPPTEAAAAGHRALSRYVSSFFAAVLSEDAASRAFLLRAPEDAIPGSSLTLERRPAASSSATYDDLVHAIITGRAREVIVELRSLAAREPDHLLLSESYMDRLAVSLLFTWGLAEEAIPLLEFMAERYPSSVRALLMLAEAHVLAENYTAAIDLYGKYVEQHPSDARARSRLESLRTQAAR